MDDYYCKRNGQIQVQIPAFGDWDNANQLPITQYFECTRQAGLIRYSSYSGESVPTCVPTPPDLYAVDLNQPSPTLPRKQTRVSREKVSNLRVGHGHGHGHGGKSSDERMMMTMKKKQQQQQKNIIITATCNNTNGKLRNVKDHQRQQLIRKGGVNPRNQDARIIAPHAPALHVNRPPPSHPKPVDEDLYKIPPELLRNSKRSKSCKMRGLFSRCLVPACNS